jgi:hypothetical protein
MTWRRGVEPILFLYKKKREWDWGDTSGDAIESENLVTNVGLLESSSMWISGVFIHLHLR